MNIFVLDKSPKIAAEFHCDKHVVKMILESAQMLCTAHWLRLLKFYHSEPIQSFKRIKDAQIWLFNNTPKDKQPPWKMSHVYHPCTVWTNDSLSNYMWLFNLGKELCYQYSLRYGRSHKSEIVIDYLGENIPIDLPDKGLTEFAICMKEEYKISSNPVLCYRNYYLKDKVRFAKWKLNNEPDWWHP